MNLAGSTVAIAAGPPREDVLGRIDAARLLELLADYYAAQGFTVERAGRESPHLFSPRAGGLKLRRNDQILVVECRPRTAHPVNQRDVERLCAAARMQQASGAIFVTADRFSARARLVGEQQPELQLIDHRLLRQMLGAHVIARLERDHPPRAAEPVPEPLHAAPGPEPAPRRRDPSPSVFSMLLMVLLLVLAWFTSK